jgi:hypothetical protein
MMELPEARTIARQVNMFLRGKRISGVTVAHTPHKLAWYYGQREKYSGLLLGQTINGAEAWWRSGRERPTSYSERAWASGFKGRMRRGRPNISS